MLQNWQKCKNTRDNLIRITPIIQNYSKKKRYCDSKFYYLTCPTNFNYCIQQYRSKLITKYPQLRKYISQVWQCSTNEKGNNRARERTCTEMSQNARICGSRGRFLSRAKLVKIHCITFSNNYRCGSKRSRNGKKKISIETPVSIFHVIFRRVTIAKHRCVLKVRTKS